MSEHQALHPQLFYSTLTLHPLRAPLSSSSLFFITLPHLLLLNALSVLSSHLSDVTVRAESPSIQRFQRGLEGGY